MKYKKPEVKEMTVKVEITTSASETASCAGGRCVRSPYENDH